MGKSNICNIDYFLCFKYVEIINSENEDWYVIIEAKIQPNSFSVHEKTIYNYNFKDGEPKNLGFRIKTSENLYVGFLT